MKVITKHLNEVELVAKDFLNNLKPNSNTATVVGLSGDLGSGKTTFSQAIGKNLGIQEFITSPTFVIIKKYSLQNQKFTNFVHIDAYRLESGRELSVLGFEKLLQDHQNLIFIEWPEKVAEILPADLIKLKFKFISENEREIEK